MTRTDRPVCAPAISELAALAAATRRDIDATALHAIVLGALQASVPWPWALQTVAWCLAHGEDLYDIKTGLYARQPGRIRRS